MMKLNEHFGTSRYKFAFTTEDVTYALEKAGIKLSRVSAAYSYGPDQFYIQIDSPIEVDEALLELENPSNPILTVEGGILQSEAKGCSELYRRFAKAKFVASNPNDVDESFIGRDGRERPLLSDNWDGGVTYGIKWYCLHFENPSEFGIDGGRISKLSMRKNGKWLMNYDRGWDIEPTDKTAIKLYHELMDKWN